MRISKDSHREKAPSNKTTVLSKIMNIDIWVVGTSNQLFIEVLKLKQNFRKKKEQLLANLRYLHFVLPILFVLTLASDSAVLYGNIALSILVLLTIKQHSRFLERNCVFQKIYFKVEVLKTFKSSSDCHIKTCRSLKRRAI